MSLFSVKNVFSSIKKATSKPVTARNAAPKWKHCINITQTSIKQLFTTTYQVRLDDHRPPGDFTAPVRHSGVQEAVLRDPHFLLRERVEDSRNRPEIVVLLFKNQMNMDYLCHNLICTFYAANIPNNTYLEEFQGIIFKNRHKKTATQPLTPSYKKSTYPATKRPHNRK